MTYSDTHKFVAIVNKTIDTGKAMNAVAHSCAGLLASAPDDLKEKMDFMDFVDKDNVAHKSISGLSLIVLRGSNGELKKARRQFIEHNIHFVDFTETMTGDTYREQLERTSQVSSEDLAYYCVAAFGEKDILDPITKRLSLWK
jgi:hypothetical protein